MTVSPFDHPYLSGLLGDEEMAELFSAAAELEAMLAFEVALARAEAAEGIIPSSAAAAIAEAAHQFSPDVVLLRQATARDGVVVPEFVRQLRQAVGGEAAAHVHFGATSQDILDTALALVSRRALELIETELDDLRDVCAALAEEHRDTVMAARTLLQQALPTTFGLKAAGWLFAAVEERRRISAQRERLAVQLGGAAGTLAWYGDAGVDLLAAYAKELDLTEPAMPWHRNSLNGRALNWARWPTQSSANWDLKTWILMS